jgi:hypothetical protein
LTIDNSWTNDAATVSTAIRMVERMELTAIRRRPDFTTQQSSI